MRDRWLLTLSCLGWCCHAPTLLLGLLWLPATMFVFWASTSTSWRSTLPASIDYVNSAASGTLNNESATTLVHAFMTSRVDYCNAVYAMSLQTISNRLQGWWTRPLELSVIELSNMIVDWKQYFTTSSTDWMSMRGLSTSLMWCCTGVCMTGRLGTSLITSSQPLMLLIITVFVYD